MLFSIRCLHQNNKVLKPPIRLWGLLGLLIYIPIIIHAQRTAITPGNPSGGLMPQVAIPRSVQFAPLTVQPVNGQSIIRQPNGQSVGPGTSPRYPAGDRRSQQIREIETDIGETAMSREEIAWLNQTKNYRAALAELYKMNPDSFSLIRAVFIVENAFMENTQSFASFCQALKLRADLVRQIVKRAGLNTKNDLALNYGIQQMFMRPNLYTNPKSGRSIQVPPFRYDFDDIMGEKDYTKLFVSKLLAQGTGQCHSMPLLYLMLAEQLGAKAWLSLSPQHSYVQFSDNSGTMFNFETTNGNLVSNTWMMESGFVTTEALKHNIYLDTLSHRQLYAQVLSDLLLGYMEKFSFDKLAEAMKERVLQINPENMIALIVDANIKTQIFLSKVNAVGRPKESDLPKYPDVYRAFQEMNASYTRIDNLGYQDMPKQAYQDWLQSIEAEKMKEGNKAIKDRMKQEIQHLKGTKLSINGSKTAN
jgi:hypothetical protein